MGKVWWFLYTSIYMMHLGFGTVQAIELLNYMIKIHMRRMSNVQNKNQNFQEVIEATYVGKRFREENLYSYDTQIWIYLDMNVLLSKTLIQVGASYSYLCIFFLLRFFILCMTYLL